MIELHEDTSPTTQLVGNTINRVGDNLAELETWVESDEPAMALALAHRMHEQLDHVMSLLVKRAMS